MKSKHEEKMEKMVANHHRTFKKKHAIEKALRKHEGKETKKKERHEHDEECEEDCKL